MITTVPGSELIRLLDDLAARGIDVWTHDGRLRYRARAGVLDDELREDVRRHRPELVEHLQRIGRLAPAGEGAAPIAPASFPMTDIQQAYWVGETGFFELGAVRAHIYLAFERPGLDLARLTAAWQRLVERHAMLRTIVDDGGRMRTLERVPAYEPVVDDVRGLDAAVAATRLVSLRDRMTHDGPTTDRWPLFEVCVALTDAAPAVHIAISLLVCDALSTAVLLRELELLYDDPACELAPLPAGFEDHARAVDRARGGEAWERARRHWLARLPELPPAPELPLRRTPEELEQARFTRHVTRVPGARWSEVKERAAEHGVTPSAVLLAAYAETLGAWCKSPRFTINVLHSERGAVPDVDRVVGNFSTTVLVEIDEHSPDADFAERARAVQRRLWLDLEHSAFSGVRVLGELNARRDQLSRAAMPVTFASALYVSEQDQIPTAGDWRTTLTASRMQTPQVWLDHQVFEDGGDLVANWDVVDGLLAEGVVEGMLGAWEGLVGGLVSGAGWVGGVGVLAGGGVGFNATDGVVSGGLLQDGFLACARCDGDAVAVVGERVLGYGELERRSAAVAGLLVGRGVGRGSLVGVVMEKGWEQVVGVLGVVRAGGAYVPVDPGWPAERRALVLEQCGVSVVLTQSWLAGSLEWSEGVGVLAVDVVDPLADGVLGEGVDGSCDGSDLAYVIFTSGSTGRPKGVAVDHRGALNTVSDVNARFGLCASDRVLGVSALTFDLSVWDVFGTLAAGGALVLPEAGAARDPAHWCELIVEHGVTVWNSAPALMGLVVEYAESVAGALGDRLRLVLLSGDWIAVGLADRVRALRDGVRVVSLGGATEASIWSIVYEIGEVDASWRSIPYGRPLANQHVYVLDGCLRERPDHVVGEIYIGGVGVAVGYYADGERTAQRFVVHPRSGERLYRTGDLGRYLPAGVIEFLGREDFQVKVQGYRIELEEVETVLAEHRAVRQVVVTAVGERDGARHLAAHVVARDDAGPDIVAQLRAHAAAKLPAYMTPHTYALLDALPLTANGKIDRTAIHTTSASPVAGREAACGRPPEGAAEEAVARVWAEVLGIEDVRADAGFIGSGGQSLTAIRLALQLERELGGACRCSCCSRTARSPTWRARSRPTHKRGHDHGRRHRQLAALRAAARGRAAAHVLPAVRRRGRERLPRVARRAPQRGRTRSPSSYRAASTAPMSGRCARSAPSPTSLPAS